MTRWIMVSTQSVIICRRSYIFIFFLDKLYYDMSLDNWEKKGVLHTAKSCAGENCQRFMSVERLQSHGWRCYWSASITCRLYFLLRAAFSGSCCLDSGDHPSVWWLQRFVRTGAFHDLELVEGTHLNVRIDQINVCSKTTKFCPGGNTSLLCCRCISPTPALH